MIGAIGAAAVFAAVFVTTAGAQIFTGAAVDPTVAMPGAPAPAVAAPPVPAPAPPPVPALRFLPNTLDGLRITGETGNIKWPVYLTAAQAHAATRFRVSYLSAVSVLADTSTLEVTINDRKIGSDAIDAAADLRGVEFDVPPDLLVPGFNAVAVSVQQRHRVDCSVPATYELWTKIDPRQTGLVLAAGTAGVAEVGDLAALLPRSDGSVPIHVLLSGKTNPAHLQRLIRATQEIALAGHMLQPAVDFSAATNDPYGVDLALGTRAALAKVPRLADRLGAVGPLVEIVPADVGGRPILVLTGSSDQEVDAAIGELASALQAHGSRAGLAAIADYPAMQTKGGQSLTLRDLGVRSQDFDGRFFRRSVNVELPSDVLASDYGRGTFDLVGGYAAGLVRGAQVRVDINGRNAGIIKLPDANGDVFKHNQMFLPLSLMRPGLNRIDIIAETARPEDAVCAQTGGRRFLMLDSSELTIPVLAHVERLPDLGLTTAGGLPFTRGTAHLVVPKPDRDTMSAALSFTARAAVAANRAVPFRFSTSVEPDEDGSTLIVSPARQLDPALMKAVGLDPAAIETLWHDLAPASETAPQAPQAEAVSSRWWMTNEDGPSACRLPPQGHVAPVALAAPETPAPPPPVPTGTAVPTSDGDDLLVAWTGRVASVSWRQRVSDAVSGAINWAQALVQDVHLPAIHTSHAETIAGDASLVLAQGMSAGSARNVTTIVTAPNAATLRAAMACLFDPQIWPKIHGRLATVNAANGDVTSIPATTFHYVASGQASIANSRLVLAGWFSLNPLAFAAAALLLALCLSGTTLWFVRNIGRRAE